jgi:elongation factor Ts
MTISASLVKEMRERTGLGMMECKRALEQTGGDLEAAIEEVRKSGQAKADKKAGRVAADGVVVLAAAPDGSAGALVEVNCETDFVAKDANFAAFAGTLGGLVLTHRPADHEALGALALDGHTVEQVRTELVARIGENIRVRRFAVEAAGPGERIGAYRHGTRIGVLVRLAGGNEALAKDLAMHVAASRPLCVAEADLPADVLERERRIYDAQAAESGKPADIRARMVEGRVRKFAAEVTLLGQPFVRDPETTVAKLLEKAGARVVGFVRYEVGEGIEKRADDFVAEVMKQARG